MIDSILVVCIGNICRSPTGEILLKKGLANKKINSAGLAALIDHPADPKSKEVARRSGVSLDTHFAKQITSTMCREHDLILVMERKHLEAICNIAPEVRGKTMLFGHWIGQQEIPDPYKKSIEAFEYVYEKIDESAMKWIDILNK